MSESQPGVQPEQPSAPDVNTASSDTPKKPRRRRTVVLGLVALALLICVGSCLAYLVWAIFAPDSWIRVIFIDRPAVTAVADEFIRALERKDAEAAYALFSTRVQQQLSFSDFQEQVLNSDLSAHVEGYEDLAIQEGGSIEVQEVVSTNPLDPQGTVAILQSVVKYEGGFEGTLYAVFEKEDGEWRVHRLEIKAEPGKLNSP